MKRTVLAALLLLAAVPASATGAGIRTAVAESTTEPLAFQRIHEAGATVVRVTAYWRAIAPARPSPAFDAADPADPQYDWSVLDEQVQRAVANGLQPLVTVHQAPLWAQKHEPHATHLGPIPIESWKPDPRALGQFAHAIATRYSGSFDDLPRVRYWELWNEPNLSQYLAPQLKSGKVVSAGRYRLLVNAFAQSVHAVRADNLVVAGALSAFRFKSRYGPLGIAPMVFMRKLLCMSAGAKPRPTCNAKVDFDVWSHHPWTSGGPTHHATEKGDVSLGDLPAMHRLLEAAIQAGHVTSRYRVQFWVTEFAWDTRPPDPNPQTAPLDLQARWVSEALYHAWKEGVSLFTWLSLRDETFPASPYQDGLLWRNGDDLRYGVPKPTFTAFKFPFVAYRAGRSVAVWGRTPWGQPGRVAVQQRTASNWRSLGVFRANRYGVFSGKVPFRRVQTGQRRRSAASASEYRDLVVSARPMAYWPLDETTGPAAGDVMNHNEGTFTGGVSFGLPGAFGSDGAIGLNGTDARVDVGTVTTVHTVELWVKTRTSGDAVAFSNRNRFHFYVAFGTAGGLTHVQDSYPIYTTAVDDGNWHYLVYTYDSTSSTGKVYVDGKLATFAVYPRIEGGGPASIGYDAAIRTYFNGDIDDVAVYSYPLAAAQIRSHYLASGRTIAPSVAPGTFRGVVVGSHATSLPFSLVRPRDRYVLPFGGGGD